MADNKIDVGGRLHSIATGNVLAGANEILDDSKNKKQSDINTETYSLVNDVNERLNGLSPDQQSALSVAAKATNNEIKLGYYVCDTEGNVAAKVISNATGYVLSPGGSMKVKMTNANTVNNATLNINSTGAKALYYDGERASAKNSWEAGETVEVYYDGTSYYANNVAGGSSTGVFDVSKKFPTSGVEGGNTYTLELALTVLNTNLSANKKEGGMQIRFISSSDNKYKHFTYLLEYENTTSGNAAFVNVENWRGIDKKPTYGSINIAESGGTLDTIDKATGYSENDFNNGGYYTFKVGSSPRYYEASNHSYIIIYVVKGDAITIYTNDNSSYALTGDGSAGTRKVLSTGYISDGLIVTASEDGYLYINRSNGKYVSVRFDNLTKKIIDIHQEQINVTNFIFLNYDTDVSTTRNKITPYRRKKGLVLSYINGNDIVIEQYVKDDTSPISDAKWDNDANWDKVVDIKLLGKLFGADSFVNKSSGVTLNNGRIKIDGTIEDKTGWKYTNPFSVAKGDIIYIYSVNTGTSSICPISKVTGEGTEQSPYVYTPLVTFSSNWNRCGYVADEDMNIAVCFRNDGAGENGFTCYGSYVLGNIIDKINSFKTKIEENGYISTVLGIQVSGDKSDTIEFPASLNGKYQDERGILIDNAAWNTSAPFQMLKGDIIKVDMRLTYPATVDISAPLCRVDSVENQVTDPLVVKTKYDSGLEYIATEDILVRLSIHLNRTLSITFTSSALSFLADKFDANEEVVKLCNIVDPSTVNAVDQEKQLVLLHFSDIHNDIRRFMRVLEYRRKNSQYIDDVLMSGDSAGSYFADFNQTILDLTGFDDVLMEIGNHDTYAPYGPGAPSGTAPTMQQLYETFLGQISNWGVIQPEGVGENDYYPCYYYKDYPACKMRLIVLDCMHWDTTQSDWFAGVLAETLDNTKGCYGYHVIGSQHYLSHDGLNNLTLFDTPFNSLDDYKLEEQSTIVNSVNVVDTFINNGGVFVCWLGGHIHSDFCGLLTNPNNYNKQIFINIGSASIYTPAQDCARIINTPTQDLFNVIGFDYYSKTIKVMRVGATYDRYLRHRDTMCIKYGDNPSLVYTS